MLKFFAVHTNCPEKLEILKMLRKLQYETFFKQGNILRACEIL